MVAGWNVAVLVATGLTLLGAAAIAASGRQPAVVTPARCGAPFLGLLSENA